MSLFSYVVNILATNFNSADSMRDISISVTGIGSKIFISLLKSVKSFGISIIISTFFPKCFIVLMQYFLKIIKLKKNSFKNSISFVCVISK